MTLLSITRIPSLFVRYSTNLIAYFRIRLSILENLMIFHGEAMRVDEHDCPRTDTSADKVQITILSLL
jgi:hypothetical protein